MATQHPLNPNLAWRGRIAQPIRERINSNHTLNPQTGCWEWSRHRNAKGYGVLSCSEGRAKKWSTLAHRASWETFVGPIPAGMNVCHHCDNPCCVNPNHLFLGTQLDNVRDCMRKGRKRNVGVRGEANCNAKLTAVDVLEIRRLNALGTSQAELGRRYGITQGVTWRIIHRQSWAHI